MGELKPEKKPLKFESLQVHAGITRIDNTTPETPIYASSSFVFNDSAHGAAIFSGQAEAFCYSRIGNPTVDIVEKRVAELEGGLAGLATSSGEAALFVTIMTLASTGSNIVVASHISDATSNQFRYRFPANGISARFVQSGNAKDVAQAIDENTKAVFIESISNEGLLVADIEELASVAHNAGVPLIVDNTAGAGGFLIRPIDHGADIVVESAAEWLSISGSTTAGVVVDSGNFNWKTHSKRFSQFTDPLPSFHGLRMWEKFGRLSFIVMARSAVLRDIGPCLNPFQASELISGIQTLSVRIERNCENAFRLATWLDGNSEKLNIKLIQYPGMMSNPTHLSAQKYLRKGQFGGVLSFEMRERSEKTLSTNFCQDLRVVSSGPSIGGNKTVVIFHSSTDVQGEELGTIAHISAGIENIDDIIADFEEALGENSGPTRNVQEIEFTILGEQSGFGLDPFS